MTNDISITDLGFLQRWLHNKSLVPIGTCPIGHITT